MLVVTGFGKERPMYPVRYNERGTRNSSALHVGQSPVTGGGGGGGGGQGGGGFWGETKTGTKRVQK
jgi:hypothetical protein